MPSDTLSDLLIKRLPYGENFLFVDQIISADHKTIVGHYTFTGKEFFYASHFTDNPVVPGVILIEMMGQIGMVAHFAWMLHESGDDRNFYPLMSNCNADFFQVVKVHEKMTVRGTVKYLRNNLLRSTIELFDPAGVMAARLDALLKMIITDP